MHASSMENMRRCFETYVQGRFMLDREQIRVADIGGADVNGSYRDVFEHKKFEYLGVDCEAGPGIDIVLDDPYAFPIADGSVDLVISGQMLEHCEFFWDCFAEMLRILKPDGLLILIVPSAGPIHRFPVDCYRFYPDSLPALARYTGCTLVESWHDQRGPWQDLVGVFAHPGWERRPTVLPQSLTEPERIRAGFPPALVIPQAFDSSAEEEVVAGSVPYLDLLARVHEELAPSNYCEIGVRNGASLALARRNALGIDPFPEITRTLPDSVKLYETTSDAFFRDDAENALTNGFDLAFVDGMHQVEFALRDFMNLERRAHPSSVIMLDDVFPNHPRQAERERVTRVWTGDVWKLYAILQEHRPDLTLLPIDTTPTGLILVAGLDSKSDALWDKYNPILSRARNETEVPTATLNREGARGGHDPAIEDLLKTMKSSRDRGDRVAQVRSQLNRWRERNPIMPRSPDEAG